MEILASTMTEAERLFQKETLAEYRRTLILPSPQDIAPVAGVSVNTVISFLKGNSPNPKMRAYIKRVAEANFKHLIPEDLEKLFDIWSKDSA